MTWSSMPRPCSPCCVPSRARSGSSSSLEGAGIGAGEPVGSRGEAERGRRTGSARFGSRSAVLELDVHAFDADARLRRRDLTRCDPCSGALVRGSGLPRPCSKPGRRGAHRRPVLVAPQPRHRDRSDPLVRAFARPLEPRLDLVALDLAGGAARQVGEGDEADLLGLLVAGELRAASGVELLGA